MDLLEQVFWELGGESVQLLRKIDVSLELRGRRRRLTSLMVAHRRGQSSRGSMRVMKGRLNSCSVT